MKYRNLLVCLLSIFSSSQVLSLTPAEQQANIEENELIREEEFQDEEFVIHEIDNEFNDLEHEGGVITEEHGPIPMNAYVDIANGTLETYDDRYTRFDSYFADFDEHTSSHTVEKGSEEHVAE